MAAWESPNAPFIRRQERAFQRFANLNREGGRKAENDKEWLQFRYSHN